MKSLLVSSLLVTITAALTHHSIARAAEQSWCRLDDPAVTEAVRQTKKIANERIGEVPCPTRSAAGLLPDELQIPMPCGHRMVLRKIRVPVSGLLGQKEAYFGDPQESSAAASDKARAAVISSPWKTYISASLSAPKATLERIYYIGKYEVTEPQYALFQAGLLEPGAADKPNACQQILAKESEIVGTRVLPATSVTWFQAIAFADAVTRYAVALDAANLAAGRAPDAIPWVEATPAFLRLPTETEWEFAARGGIVAPDSQQQKVYMVAGTNGQPIVPEISDIASLTSVGADPPDGKAVFYVGRKQPNLLGLYDMLGNADEMTSDLFRPIEPSGIIGAVTGGIVVRGGNASSPADIVSVGMRREMPLYRREGPNSAETTGFRLALSGAIFVNRRNAKYEEMVGNPDLDKDLEREIQAVTAPSSAAKVEGLNIKQQVTDLQKKLDEKTINLGDLKQRVVDLQGNIVRANAAINERNSRIRDQMLDAQVGLAHDYMNLQRRILLGPFTIQPLKAQYEATPINSPDKERLGKLLGKANARLDRLKATQRQAFSLYVNNLVALAQDGGADLENSIATIKSQIAGRNDQDYIKAMNIVTAHLLAVINNKNTVSPEMKINWAKEMSAEDLLKDD